MQTYETDVTSVSNTPLAVITLTWQSCKREQGIFQVATWQGIEGSRSGKGIFISGELMQCKRLTKHIWWKPQPSWKPVQTTAKKSSKFIKKITHIDDIMIHNLVKYLVQTLFRLWDIKITNFYLTNEVEFGQYILQDCASSYHLHVWFFWVNLDNFFAMICTNFHKIMVSTRYVPYIYTYMACNVIGD